MKTLDYQLFDKSSWPAGQWKTEPDKREWQDETTELQCLIVRTKITGVLCGYVGVLPGHVAYELDPSNQLFYINDICPHGGLTYAGKSQGPICHKEKNGKTDDVWWLGFDCDHYGDLAPIQRMHGIDSFFGEHQYYRNIEYVTQECVSLAKQLHSLNQPQLSPNNN